MTVRVTFRVTKNTMQKPNVLFRVTFRVTKNEKKKHDSTPQTALKSGKKGVFLIFEGVLCTEKTGFGGYFFLLLLD